LLSAKTERLGQPASLVALPNFGPLQAARNAAEYTHVRCETKSGIERTPRPSIAWGRSDNEARICRDSERVDASTRFGLAYPVIAL